MSYSQITDQTSTLNLRLLYWQWDWYITCYWCVAVKCHKPPHFRLSLKSHTALHVYVVADKDPKCFRQHKAVLKSRHPCTQANICTATKVFLLYLQCVLSLNICLYLLSIFLPFHRRLFSVHMASQVHHNVSGIKARFSAVRTQRMIYMTYPKVFSVSMNYCIQDFSVGSFL